MSEKYISKLSLPLLKITFELNHLSTILYSVNLSTEDRELLHSSIQKVHDCIGEVDARRQDIQSELLKIVNAMGKVI